MRVLKHLNDKGIGHLVAIMLIVVATGLAGSFMLFKSHADTVKSKSSCQMFGSGKDRRCATRRQREAMKLSKDLLNNSSILYGSKQAKRDLKTIKNGKYITKETCGKKIVLDPDLLISLQVASERYKIKVGNFVTGRGGCDRKQHPKGRAMDIIYVKDKRSGKHTNFTNGRKGNNNTVNRQFVRYISKSLPKGSMFGQLDCPGRKVKLPKGIHSFSGDTCNHQHIDAR